MNKELLKKIYDDANYIVTFKDESLKFLYCNKFTLRFLGLKRLEDILGKTDHEVSWAKYADLYTNHAEKSLMDTSSLAIWPAIDSEKRYHVAVCQRTVINNGNKKNILTHTSVLKEKDHLEIADLMQSKESYCSDLLENAEEVKSMLTRRESECLFHLLRGRSSKTIASILGISSRTVEAHIDGLRFKFRCSYRTELVEKAIEMGFLHYIPESFLNSSL